MDTRLEGMHIAILATDMFEEAELAEPRKALQQAGAQTHLIAPQGSEIIAANHFDKGPSYEVDLLLEEADPADYDAVLLPGGALNADNLRVNENAQAFVRQMEADGKPIAFICHAPWLLVSVGLVKGRTLTSFHTIADDIENAGGNWVDEEVVTDANWVSSRKPDDIPAFNEEMLALFAEHHGSSKTSPTRAMKEPVFGEKLSPEEED